MVPNTGREKGVGEKKDQLKLLFQILGMLEVKTSVSAESRGFDLYCEKANGEGKKKERAMTWEKGG